MGWLRHASVTLAALTLLTACGTTPEEPTPPEFALPASPLLAGRPCPVEVPAGTRCGFLLVPERRDVAGSRTIKVGFAVHRSTSPRRRPDAVVYSSGGPGSASLQLTGYLAAMSLGAEHDVVVVEQRGGRWSEPRLECPEIVDGYLAALASPKPPVADAAGVREAGAACRTRLAGAGVDLRGYRSDEIAADVVDLRRALGYARWNLFGVSYSTRTMLAAAAKDPGGTRAVVLDSFLPPPMKWYDEGESALGHTAAVLAKGAGGAWPDLVAQVAAVTRRYNRTPAELSLTHPGDGRSIPVRLTGDDVATLLKEALADTTVASIGPTLVDQLAAGRVDILQPIVDGVVDSLVSHEIGLYYAVQCQDEVPFNAFAGARLFTSVYDRAVCEGWRLPPSPTSADAPVTVSAPVLTVAGQYDPTTPPGQARTATEALPHGRFVEFDGVSHAVFLSSWCGRQTISAFVADPAAPPPCDTSAAPYPLVEPGDLHITPRVYDLDRGAWWPLLMPAVFVLACVAQLVVAVVAAVRRRTPRRRAALLAVGGATGLGFVVAVALALRAAYTANVTSLAVGVPAAVPWYGVTLVVSATATVAAVAVRPTGRAAAVPIAASVAAAGFLVWWFAWFL